jgi:hypothetical protein
VPYKDKAKNDAARRAYVKKNRHKTEYKRARVVSATKWRTANKERVKEQNRQYKLRNPANIMIWQAKDRARRQGLYFDLKLGDVNIPEFCPVLGIRLAKGVAKWADSSPSLDRIVPAFGYTKDNVRVISWRANNLKRDGTAEEFERIAAYIRGEL